VTEALADAVAWVDRDHFDDDGSYAGRCVFVSSLPSILDRIAPAPSAPEIADARSRIGESMDRVTGALNDVLTVVGPPPGWTPPKTSVTPEQVETAAAAIYELDPLPYCGDGSWADLLGKAREESMGGGIASSIANDHRVSARTALAAALGIEVRS
jgi:hypothetical protein